MLCFFFLRPTLRHHIIKQSPPPPLKKWEKHKHLLFDYIPNLKVVVLTPPPPIKKTKAYFTSRVRSGQQYVDNSLTSSSPLPTQVGWNQSLNWSHWTIKPMGFWFCKRNTVSFAFVTLFCVPLAFQCLKLLQWFPGNPNPALSPHERCINPLIGLRYYRPFIKFVICVWLRLLWFLTCRFCDALVRGLIVAYPL